MYIALFASLLFTSSLLAQEKIISQNVSIRILAPEVLSEEKETLFGLYFEVAPEWHVYWQNPGDSGAAPKFSFVSENAEIGSVQWPTPVRIPVAHLTNLGYEGNVAYLFPVKPKNKGAAVEIAIDLEWLVCKVECLPGFGKLIIKRPVHSHPDKWNANDQKLLRKYAAQIPSSSDNSPFQIVSSTIEDQILRVKLSSSTEGLELFPLDSESVNPAAPKRSKNEFEFTLAPSGLIPESVGFVASSPKGAWKFESVPVARPTSHFSIWLILLSAILGGFFLNLMPCVFPVISIKVFSLLKARGSERTRDCLNYSAGVLLTFTALGLLFLILRMSGSAVGWGFQLQSPPVILALVILFWLMALSFLGAFEIGNSIVNFAGRHNSIRSSSFMTGALSVFVAAPCTGPFMGAALGAATTVSATISFLIFISLGFGLAFPFLVFAIAPQTLNWLPKPGPWMISLKQFFAFPLFATMLWLLWVLGQQVGTSGWLLASIALLIVSLAIWLGQSKNRSLVLLSWLLGISGVGAVGLKLQKAEGSAVVNSHSTWLPYAEQKLSEARAKGQPVFVDFTAAWCITCQVNKQVVLDTERGQALFKKGNFLTMRADWTRYDPIITRALEKLGRNSVPVYAFYPSDGSAPKLLPQILTIDMIEDLILKP